MPRSSEHRAKAERNRLVLAKLDPFADGDWIAIVAFYRAMHLVERLAARDNLHHKSHSERDKYLQSHRRHREILRPYRFMFDAGHLARYGTASKFDQAFPGDAAHSVLVGTHLAAVEVYVEAAFAPPAGGSPAP